MPTTSSAAVEISDLWFSYGPEPVIKNSSLTVFCGERACLIGPNGGGKTTILKLMLGLLTPDKGTIKIFGNSPAQAARYIGYAPQHAQFDFSFPVNVMDVVMMGTLGTSSSNAKNAAIDALQSVGISKLQTRSMAELSGGQRQRVLIARALACKPRLLLLDEPTANLDIGVEQEFHQMLENLDKSMTIMIVSHDMGFVAEMVDKVICVSGDMAVHPTAELTGELMLDLYGHDVRMIRHDHDCRMHTGESCNRCDGGTNG